jgi:hypothetical protein
MPKKAAIQSAKGMDWDLDCVFILGPHFGDTSIEKSKLLQH